MNDERQPRGKANTLARWTAASLLIGLAMMLILTTSPHPTLAQDQDIAVLLKSRQFVPEPGIEPAVQRQQQIASPDERIHVFMQFWQIPSDSERASLEDAGVDLLAYVPTNTWFASMPAGTSLQSETLAMVRWIGTIQPEDRMAPALRAGQGARVSHADGTVSLDLRFFSDITSAEVSQIVAKYNGVIEASAPEFHRFTVRVDPGSIEGLAGEDGVQWITDAPPPKTTENDGSRARTNVDALHDAPYNLSGADVDLGIWDGGVVDNHVDFSGRLTVVDTGASVDSHATHVAGTMAGDGSNSASQGGTPFQWKGMAPGADIISYYWDNNLTDHNSGINTYGIELSQNSWGYTISSVFGNCSLYGDYDGDAPDYDSIITGLYGKRISVIFAGGNERDDGDCGMSSTPPYLNYAKLGPPATAKNIIAVGATNSDDDTMTDFSSWGPVDDGRIKPDVVAPGCEAGGEGYIHSTLPGNTYGSPIYCGTSMAAPAVSGISGLIVEQYRTSYGADPLPSTVKALLIQTAVDLDDGTVYYNPGPDYSSGYGRVDAQAAVDGIIARHVREDQISNGQTDSFTFDVLTDTVSLKVTLAWDDEPGAVNASPALVNNLDLVLVEPDGATMHRPWVLNPANPSNNATTGIDSVNNVEQVQVHSPMTGTWEARVIGTNVPVGPQGYSLVAPLGGSAPSSVYIPLIIKSGTPTSQPPPSGPTAGFWRTDSQGVEFYVTTDQASVADFAAYITVSGCGDYKITHTSLEPISNDQFSFGGSFYASGTFSSETAASGVTGLNSFLIPGCGFVSGGPWPWDATWRSSAQPSVTESSEEPVSVESVSVQTGQQSYFGATRSAPPTSD
jgi:subtilisin family serine protease